MLSVGCNIGGDPSQSHTISQGQPSALSKMWQIRSKRQPFADDCKRGRWSLQGIKAILRVTPWWPGWQFRGQSSAIWRQKRKVGTKGGLLVNKHGVTGHYYICIGLFSRLVMVMMMMMMMVIMKIMMMMTMMMVVMMMMQKTTAMTVGMCGCEAHWSQWSEGLTEQTMEHWCSFLWW